ncbi:MAG: sigma-70 family RNA polymerase sigma factor [Vicinamibacterales bacterium]
MNGQPTGRDTVLQGADDASAIAADVKAHLDAGRREAAADRFGDLVGMWQRRANRLAYYYLGNAADADEAVQDAFVKVYAHMTTFRADLSFDAWFTRILVNTCLDRLKGRRRGGRPTWDPLPVDEVAGLDSGEPSAERRLIGQATWQTAAEAIRQLPARQRDAFLLCHLHESTPAEAADALGMNPATFRVHLFRAVRKLRSALGVS